MKKLLLVGALVCCLLLPAAAHAKRINLTMSFGQDVLLASNGAVSVRARCLLNDAGFDKLQIYATTTSNAVLRGGFGSYPGNGSYLTAVTPAVNSMVAAAHGSTGNEFITNSIDGAYVVNIDTMEGFAVRAETAVLGLNTGADACLLSIELTAIKKFKVPK